MCMHYQKGKAQIYLNGHLRLVKDRIQGLNYMNLTLHQTGGSLLV